MYRDAGHSFGAGEGDDPRCFAAARDVIVERGFDGALAFDVAGVVDLLNAGVVAASAIYFRAANAGIAWAVGSFDA